MPEKYQIRVSAQSPRFPTIPRSVSIETSRCLGCRTCVKNTACVYNVYRGREFDAAQSVDSTDARCAVCFRCVQECKNNILSRVPNPRYERLGDEYWTPQIIASLWQQAENGKVPVSGAGYRGPFAGPGFDQIWTDMSEIVRPTRDGIHGREYISTMIELGRRPAVLAFLADGRPARPLPSLVRIPLPIILDLPNKGRMGVSTRLAMITAAQRLQTLAVAEFEEAKNASPLLRSRMIVKVDPSRHSLPELAGVPMFELADQEGVEEAFRAIKAAAPEMAGMIRLPLDEKACKRVRELARAGAEVILLQADAHGRGRGAKSGAFLAALVREVHLALVNDSLREQISLLAGGGIALAEHAVKTIICGADGVTVDYALLVAMECRLCRECADPAVICPVKLDEAPVEHGAQRIVNLLGSWHSQILEVMGAMGLREVRRLRGEVGRAMFFDELERDIFAPLFARRRPETAAPSPPQEPEPAPPPLPADASRPFPLVADKIKPCPSRYRNRLGKFMVVRTQGCVNCGRCAEVCAAGVHLRSGGGMERPRSWLCRGPAACRRAGAFCVDHCPQGALRVAPDPAWKAFGDPRWTADLIASTWTQAETGWPPTQGQEYRHGASGGGFDRMDFVFPAVPPHPDFPVREIDLSVPLNRRDDGRPQVVLGFPVYGGGMSFGSISLATMLARARAYAAFHSFTCTGEGGYPGELAEYDDHVITQVATGLFGVREETIQRARMVEFKYAQGAKPGLGGHLLGDKVTAAVARMREVVQGRALFSPFPFHSVYSVEDHRKHVDWIKHINPRALVSVKVSSPADVDMVAVGSYYAGAHLIHIDGSYGGTGAAPDIAKKNIAMPIEYAIPKVHAFLRAEGIRDQMTLIASGGLRSAWDIAKAIALGADGVVIGTAELVALECIRCGNCESGRGCPRGIATTDSELSRQYWTEYGSQRLINLFHAFAVELQNILWRLGMKSVRELVGRSDVLRHLDYENQENR